MFGFTFERCAPHRTSGPYQPLIRLKPDDPRTRNSRYMTRLACAFTGVQLSPGIRLAAHGVRNRDQRKRPSTLLVDKTHLARCHNRTMTAWRYEPNSRRMNKTVMVILGDASDAPLKEGLTVGRSGESAEAVRP